MHDLLHEIEIKHSCPSVVLICIKLIQGNGKNWSQTHHHHHAQIKEKSWFFQRRVRTDLVFFFFMHTILYMHHFVRLILYSCQCDSDWVERWTKKDENHSINLNHPFLKFDFIFFVSDWLSECIRMDSSVQYPFNAWCCQTLEYSQRLQRQSFQTTFHIHFYALYHRNETMKWTFYMKENAHVSIEIKPFDFFCSSLFFIFYCLEIFNVQMFVLSLKLTYEIFLSVEYHYEPLLSSFLHLFTM